MTNHITEQQKQEVLLERTRRALDHFETISALLSAIVQDCPELSSLLCLTGDEVDRAKKLVGALEDVLDGYTQKVASGA